MTQPSVRDPQVLAQLDELVRHFGGDPEAFEDRLVRDIMQTALLLLREGADTGERKMIARSLRELRYALKVFRPHRAARKISIFGSARTPVDHADYQTTVRFGRSMAEAGWMVITGAGDGIMRAGHEGAGAEASFGVSIQLPFETTTNDIIAGDPKNVTFRYFFTRKLIFVSQAHALALLPGGFGTLDECLEVLTLVQTGKSPLIPIVMVEPPGNDYWQHFDLYVREHLLAKEMIDADDLNLYQIFTDPVAAARHVTDFYRNYHSKRFVQDRLVIRLSRPPSPAQIDALNDEFADLVVDGRIEGTGPLEGETTHLDLPRITFHYTRRDYGRLRLLIDRLNQFAAAT